jgi:hypothetical protein
MDESERARAIAAKWERGEALTQEEVEIYARQHPETFAVTIDSDGSTRLSVRED